MSISFRISVLNQFGVLQSPAVYRTLHSRGLYYLSVLLTVQRWLLFLQFLLSVCVCLKETGNGNENVD